MTPGKKTGVVVNSRRGDYWTELVVLLTPEELSEGKGLLLGEFVRVVFREDGHPSNFVGLVSDAYYAPVVYSEYVRDLAQGHMNDADFQSKDPWIAKSVNFLHYRVTILGAYEEGHRGFRFRPSTRLIPPILHAEVRRFTEEELRKLVAVTLDVAKAEEESQGIGLGYLCYGSEPDGKKVRAVKPVNPALFKGRRTANFGKTGFGKSNENKVIITLVAHAFPDVGFLILDLNGEYALQTAETTSMGLVQAFSRLGLKNRVRFYTARDLTSVEEDFRGQLINYNEYVEVRPLKVDFYRHPKLAIELAFHRAHFLGEKPPQYLENAYYSWEEWERIDNRMAYVFGAFKEIGLKPSPGWKVRYSNGEYVLEKDWDELRKQLESGSQGKKGDKDGDKNGARELYRRKNRFSFLREFHAPGKEESFIERIRKDLLEEEGKVVILDLPSLGGMADFFTQRLMAELFQRAVKHYGKRQANFIVVLEEAHNVLGDQAGVFYRVAKEGRKYGIGMLYSTQSPASIPMEILSQTENFLVKHVSSEEDVKPLRKAKVAFAPVAGFLLSEPIVGYSYVYFEPYQPFVVPLQVRLLEDVVEELREQAALKSKSKVKVS